MALPAHANVYATNIRLNGGTTNVTLNAGGSVAISYLLNEDATAGVTIALKLGAATIRTIVLTNGGPGALRGANSVDWNGKNDANQDAAAGTYAVSITAAAAGYNDWTPISSDTNAGNYVYAARGIAVNRNPSSLYYGRVFVGNSFAGGSPIDPGNRVGILKLNADGSYAEEGPFSTGGYPWAGGFYSPWKVEVGDDDRVYVSDLSPNGLVMSFDQLISTNSLRLVLRSDNWPPGVSLNGLSITGSGTNMQIWMADANQGGRGILRWNLNAAGVIASNNLGTTIVRSGVVSNLDLAPFDVALDSGNRIYTIQNVVDPAASPLNVLLRFPPPVAANTPETNADWAIGRGDAALGGARGVAVDPTGTYVSMASIGVDPDYEDGAVRVFAASNGTNVAVLTPAPSHQHYDTAWDNAGNLYATDDTDYTWRAYSPPGSNQATTVAIPLVLVATTVAPPVLSGASYAAGQFHFTLTGTAGLTYIIQSSTNLQTWTPVVTNSDATATRPITVPAPASRSFFRAQAAP